MSTEAASVETQMWDLVLMDAEPGARVLNGLTVGDIDGDERNEIVVGGEGVLRWYRPATSETGVIAEGRFNVGLVAGDLDGDGMTELVTAREITPVGNADMPRYELLAYKREDHGDRWRSVIIDPDFPGHLHDVIMTDIDGDGKVEIVSVATYSSKAGIYLLRRPQGWHADADGPASPWPRHTVSVGHDLEGTAVADLDLDGELEIVCGPDIFKRPRGGAFDGEWLRFTYAPSFREMCRVVAVDLTGNGYPDIVVAESEYLEGRLSWFESSGNDWIEHRLASDLYYAHSLSVWEDRKQGRVDLYAGEMAQGGWDVPANRNARVERFRFHHNGSANTRSGASPSVERTLVYRGEGTHEATVCDLDRHGEPVVVGKRWQNPRIQIFRLADTSETSLRSEHFFIDRDKPEAATELFGISFGDDGPAGVVCGRYWYEHPGWRRHEIPGIYQAINAVDVDGDGRPELICTLKAPNAKEGFYNGLSSRFCWAKAVDPLADRWEIHNIGEGSGDWPHGNAIAELLPGGRLGFVACYHDINQGSDHYPELFEIPPDPKNEWKRRPLVDYPYGEQIVPFDLDGDGQTDLVTGECWLENLGNGEFHRHQFSGDFFDLANMPVPTEDHGATRVAVMDVTGNGRKDIIVGEQALDFTKRLVPYARLVWFEHPEDPRETPWKHWVIDTLYCPHSLDVADVDGDGEEEIVCGEHYPFALYRSGCRLYVYKRADKEGRQWRRYTIDDRFEHHVGARVVHLPGMDRPLIVSHGWRDSRYLNGWQIL